MRAFIEQPADRGNITHLAGSKLAPTTIRRRIGTLRNFYRWSIRLRHRRDPINPVREGVHGLVSVPLTDGSGGSS